ncbi:IgG-binding virulence factor TspB family protein [Neisseria gonorrhoeae]|nr:IgG-binding virulence factor TspB family protein [Neisseria gonorrhoeae]UWT36666.1 IgG-binding virulence factor TspB family protein [Neisseria gonorrhoeae]
MERQGCAVNKGDDFSELGLLFPWPQSEIKRKMDAKKPEEILSLKVDARSRQIHKGNRISRLFRKSRSRTRNKK